MEKTLKKISLLWVYLAGIMIVLIVVMTVFNITSFSLDKIARMFDSNVGGLPGYEDLVRLLMSCIALMFFPWAGLEKTHIAIEFFTENFSKKNLIIIDKFWLIVTQILVIFLAIMMFLGMIESYEDGALSRILGWAEWPFYICGILSLILWSFVLFYQIVLEKEGHKND